MKKWGQFETNGGRGEFIDIKTSVHCNGEWSDGFWEDRFREASD